MSLAGTKLGGDSEVTLAHNTIDTWDYGATYSSPPTGTRGQNAVSQLRRQFS